MPVRRAAPNDLDAIKACAEGAYQMYVARIGKTPAPMVADFALQISQGIVDVFVEGDDLLGFIVHYPRGDHIHIENIAVNPACQGRGVGRLLIDHAETAAQEYDLKALELYTNEMMTENLSYYQNLGYIEIERRQEDGFSRVYYRKELGV